MHTIAWWPTLIVLALATFTDLRSRRIPNWLVFPFLLSGIAVSSWFRGWHGFGQSCAGLGLGFLVYGFIFWMGGMGAGDVKLCAAIGAWIGPNQLFIALVMTGIAGGIMAICWSIYRKDLGDVLKSTGSLLGFKEKRGVQKHRRPTIEDPFSHKMPYAPAIAIGTLLSFLSLPR